ncbi:MAG: glutathione S-transferase family protein [Pseudomonadales bacterium]
MKLYMVPLAPNPTKVMLYIAEREALGVAMGIQQVVVNTLKGRQREPEHLARNPFGTLPVLELDDGSYLLESLAIIQYLEDRFPEQALLVGSPEARGHARDVERIIDIRIAGPMAAYVHATKSPLGLPPDPGRAAEIEASLETPLDYLEHLLADGRELLLGNRVNIADCTLAASLQFLRYIGADLFGDRRRLSAWDARYRERPAAKSVLRW